MLFGLETLSVALALYQMLQGAITHCLSCMPETVSMPTHHDSSWSFEAISILTGLSKCPRHFLHGMLIHNVCSFIHGAWILLLENPCHGSLLVYTYFRHDGMSSLCTMHLATNTA
jgi:hypothetical protein